MNSIRTKVEPVKTKNQFNEFVKKHNFEFSGMSVSKKREQQTRWLMCSSDENITEIMINSLDFIGYDYIIYSGKIDGRFYVATEIRT